MFESEQNKLTFYNYNSREIQDSILEDLKESLWEDFNMESYFYNDFLLPNKLAKAKKLFSNFHQIIPGTIWNKDKERLELDLYKPKFIKQNSFYDFLDLCERYFSKFKKNKIGVHLSGGFDSGLIICILHHLKIPFTAIGLCSSNFEFRTEKRIQEILKEKATESVLLDMQNYPFFSDIKTKPIHQIPDSDIKSINSTKALIKEFKRCGCDIVFSGQGGDSLFVDAISDFRQVKYNIGNEFLPYPQNERYYFKEDIELISFYSNKDIINFFSSARLGQKEDVKKLWVRNWAKSILPKELSEFTYTADFFGLTTDGLMQAKNDIKDLLEEAYDISKMPQFSPMNIKKFLMKDIFSFEFKDYIKYCSLISIASWYHSLFNNE